MARIDSFLRLVAEQKASDLHFHAGDVPVIRYNNDIIPLPFRALSETESRRFIYGLLSEEQRAQFEREKELDFVYEMEGVARFRSNIFLQHDGMSAVFRVVPNRLPSFEELNLPMVLKKLTRLNNGMVLVTGPTGSGKTTTLAALVNEINRTSHRHVITIEDPIEFIHLPINSIITQRQVGDHTTSFEEALRSALREAPDVIIVGELRDLETISLALTAAETGVLVFGTMHTSTAPKAVHRIIDAIPEHSREQMRGVLSVLLRGVVAQRLCKRASGDGRVAVLEIMRQNWAISHLIRDNKVHQIEGYLQSQNLEISGMQSFERCLFNYIRDELITKEEGLKTATSPELLESLCAKINLGGAD